jgi:hypothetical protein
MVALEADVHQVDAAADDLAVLVQPGGVRPVGLVHRDLFDPAPEGNIGAFGIVQGNVTEGNTGAPGFTGGL